ncbi:MAG: hypothetical protein VKJ02_10260 [Snowella sp.]|nr:hypothetical protein [Snowella sp.]
MTTAPVFSNAPDITGHDYCVIGLSTCFIKDDGEFHQVNVLEPIPSAALEAILKGVPTSFQWARAMTVGEVIVDDQPSKSAYFPESAQFCDNFVERIVATIRTYKSRPQAQVHIPLGSVREDLNYSLERKRVLNATNIVRAEDNVKQHPHTHQVL